MRNSLYEQLYKKIANDIRTGVLKTDAKLPSIRKYAEENGISINTVIGAYNLLLAEGYIYAKDKSGYYVSQFEEAMPKPQQKAQSLIEPKESDKNTEKAETAMDLSANLVDSSLFPYSTLRQLYRETLSGNNITLLEHAGSFMGDEDLRASIAKYVYTHKGIVCTPKQVIIGNGTTYHLQILPRLFDKESVFLMESPGYAGSNDVIKDIGKPILQIPVDDEGASIQSIREVSKAISDRTVLLHISPSHQFPLGTTMTAPRRSSILKWANEAQNRFIIEDDYDSDFRYNGHPIPSLCSMDTSDKVIYLGTFSRTLTPSLRISYMILPQAILERYQNTFAKYPCPVSRIDQKVVSLFMDGGYFERHISRMRRIYKTRRNAMLSILQTECPQVQIKGEEAGMHFIAKFPCGEAQVIGKAKENAILLNGTGTGWIIVGYAHLSQEDMQKFRLFLRNL